MSRLTRMTYDERVLLNCSDDDIAIVSDSEDGPVEQQLDQAIAQDKSAIAVKDLSLARDISFWLKFGLHCRSIVVLSATAATSYSILGCDRLSKFLAYSCAVAGTAYCLVWHWDPIYSNYHLLRDERLLMFMGSRYRSGTNVVLIQKKRRWTGLLLPIIAPALAVAIAYRKEWT